MSSIRATLQRRLLAALGALLLLSGATLYLVIRVRLLGQFDLGLEAKARLLASQTKYEGRTLDADFIERPTEELSRTQAPDYLELRSPDGQVLFRSPSLGAGELPRGARRCADLRLPDGRPGRSVALRLVPPVEGGGPGGLTSPPPVILTLAQGREGLDASLAAILAALIGIGTFLLAGLALVVTRVVPAGLRPLERVATAAAAIDAGTLDARFPEIGLPVELIPICARLNELLRRLEVSFRRERRFASDVAHELRTPLAELRTAAQVVLRWPEGEAPLQALRETLEITAQMDRIVANLLALARCDEGRQPVVVEPVDLASAARDGWRPFQVAAARQGLVLHLDAPPTLVATDRTLLGQILTNLFSNAVDYTPPGGQIDCTLVRTDGRVALTVANTTQALEVADLPHLFEPFWRKDVARTERDHVGLGLALVSAFTARLRIEVGAALAESGRFAITLRFP